jgi:hypothetical protein
METLNELLPVVKFAAVVLLGIVITALVIVIVGYIKHKTDKGKIYYSERLKDTFGKNNKMVYFPDILVEYYHENHEAEEQFPDLICKNYIRVSTNTPTRQIELNTTITTSIKECKELYIPLAIKSFKQKNQKK